MAKAYFCKYITISRRYFQKFLVEGFGAALRFKARFADGRPEVSIDGGVPGIAADRSPRHASEALDGVWHWVEAQLQDFKERDIRKVQVFDVDDAEENVLEPGLKTIIRNYAKSVEGW